MFCMKHTKRYIIAAFVMVFVIGCLFYMWHTNRIFFQGNSVAGLPDGQVRIWNNPPSHFDLVFNRHGSVNFNHFGTEVSVYIAFYRQDELIMHESVVSIQTVDYADFSGSAFWGLTTERNSPCELRVSLNTRGVSWNYFDFSLFDFEPRLILSPGGGLGSGGRIEYGKQYVMQVWKSGNTFSPDGNMFRPEILRTSEHTAILYIVFR